MSSDLENAFTQIPFLNWIGMDKDEYPTTEVDGFSTFTRVALPNWENLFTVDATLEPLTKQIDGHAECNTIFEMPSYKTSHALLNPEQYVKFSIVEKFKRARSGEETYALNLYDKNCINIAVHAFDPLESRTPENWYTTMLEKIVTTLRTTPDPMGWVSVPTKYSELDICVHVFTTSLAKRTNYFNEEVFTRKVPNVFLKFYDANGIDERNSSFASYAYHMVHSDIFLRSGRKISQLLDLVSIKPLTFASPYLVDQSERTGTCMVAAGNLCTQEVPLLELNGLDPYHIQRLVQLRRRI